MTEISVSTLDINEENAVKTFYNLEAAKIDYFHIDVMDGNFAGEDNINKMKNFALELHTISMTPLDVHLMVENPRDIIDYFIDQSVDRITFHYESCKDKDEILDIAKYLIENGIKVGIAINPDTQIDKIYDILPYIHQVLIMTVVPGKGGQTFISEMCEKIKTLKMYCDEKEIDIDIGVDGGINESTAKEAIQAGANILVSGNYILKSSDYKKAVNSLRDA